MSKTIENQINFDDAQALRKLADDIVSNHKRFAWTIVSAWLDSHNFLLVSRPTNIQRAAQITPNRAKQ